MDWIWTGYGLDTGLSDYVISNPYPYPIKSIVIHGYHGYCYIVVGQGSWDTAQPVAERRPGPYVNKLPCILRPLPHRDTGGTLDSTLGSILMIY